MDHFWRTNEDPSGANIRPIGFTVYGLRLPPEQRVLKSYLNGIAVEDSITARSSVNEDRAAAFWEFA